MKVTQLCPTLWTVHGILQARILEWVAFPSWDIPNSRIKPGFPALQVDSLPTELSGKAWYNKDTSFLWASYQRASFNLITSKYPMNPTLRHSIKYLADTHLQHQGRDRNAKSEHLLWTGKYEEDTTIKCNVKSCVGSWALMENCWNLNKIYSLETFPAVQWLRLHTSAAGAMGSILDCETRFSLCPPHKRFT